ncbi:flagellar basal body P-ring formation chaperone FlgA [Coralliovum pocilloporae]|uniref:flagellar basal body P-ring formation chaperone FlgA n=1 Tax=Coralliovum pocilloporae TaxID=3066369 RepID=UPI003307A4D5
MVLLDMLYRTGLVIVLAFVFLTTPTSANSFELEELDGEIVPRLRTSVQVDSYYVTIGDLFENAGVLSEKAIFRAPDLGTSGRVRAETVAAAARRAGMTRMDTDNVISVTVGRNSKQITEDLIKDIVADEVRSQSRRVIDREITVTVDEFPSVLHADPTSATPVRVARFRHADRNGRFELALIIDQGMEDRRITVSGRAIETVEVATLARALGRSEVVQEGDIILQRIPVRQALRIDPVNPSELVGMASKRPLRAGAQVAKGDFTLPVIVPRNSIVSILFKAKGLTLSVRGRALSDGAVGDTITVLNAQSKRTLQAVVEAPGLVTVGGGIGPVASLGGEIQ